MKIQCKVLSTELKSHLLKAAKKINCSSYVLMYYAPTCVKKALYNASLDSSCITQV